MQVYFFFFLIRDNDFTIVAGDSGGIVTSFLPHNEPLYRVKCQDDLAANNLLTSRDQSKVDYEYSLMLRIVILKVITLYQLCFQSSFQIIMALIHTTYLLLMEQT